MNELGATETRRKRSKQVLTLFLIILVASVGIYAPRIIEVMTNGLILRHSGEYLGHFRYGSVVTHKFDILNVSLRTAMIGIVEPGCTCSVASVSNYKIPRFRKSTITMKVDTGKLGPGKVAKGVRVRLMDGRSIDACYVTFVVDTSPGGRPSK